MDEVFNVGDTILLDGEPLALVTQAGVESWIEKGVPHSYRYGQVRGPLSGKVKCRCLYEKAGVDTPFVLINDSKIEDRRVILFDSRPA